MEKSGEFKRFELFEVYSCYLCGCIAYFIPIGIQDESDKYNRIINAIAIVNYKVVKGVYRCYVEYGNETVKEHGFIFTPNIKPKISKFMLGKIDCDNE